MTIPSRHSLLGKIIFSTSVAITLILAAAGWFAQSVTRNALSDSLHSDIQASLGSYQALWQSRTEMLRSVSRALSNMSDVRRAFQTNDRATIQDTAGEIWSRVSETGSDGVFLVTDPRGNVIASLGGGLPVQGRFSVVADAAARFPDQSNGFSLVGGRLFTLVVTPVYVQAESGSALLNVLVAGFPVDRQVARDLSERAGGSDFVFLSEGKPVASTLSASETAAIARQYHPGSGVQEVKLEGREFAMLGSTLRDLAGAPAGDLLILHNYDAIAQEISALEKSLLIIWVAAVGIGIAVSALLARRILRPIRQLDQAAALIAGENYSARVPEGGVDELGRLAGSFNAMAGSIQSARAELIRRERISTIGQLSSSIVHDLRNPLAAIYGGAEMMMDGDLSQEQLQRLAGNIYRSSRAIKDMLQELVDVSRGRIQPPETCQLSEVVSAAIDIQAAAAAEHGIAIREHVDRAIELPLERARMERVFVNLLSNAIEAMPGGGEISLSAKQSGQDVLIAIDDNGPGIPAALRDHLFQPFVVSAKNGLGLGLALSRQTLLDHGGDMWIDKNNPANGGAHFRIRLPVS